MKEIRKMYSIDNKVKDAYIPDYSGLSKSGCKIFKGTPHIINRYRNSLIFANILSVALCVLCMVTFAIISALVDGINQGIQDFCHLVFMFSLIALILTLCVSSTVLISFNKTVSKIYLCISRDGLEGITKNQNDKIVYYTLTYDDIQSVTYSIDEIIIETYSGVLLIYDVFYNPHEIYKTIYQMSGELERLAV